MFSTEYDFTLPRGCIGDDGVLQRTGKMRLATAADEIYPLRDPRVRENPEYLTVLILSRVITELGSISEITPKLIETLFIADLTYLQDLYNRINQTDNPCYESVCPECGSTVKIPVNFQQAGR